MAIEVRSGRHLGVAENVHDHTHRHALREQERRRVMSQVVEPLLRQPAARNVALKRLRTLLGSRGSRIAFRNTRPWSCQRFAFAASKVGDRDAGQASTSIVGSLRMPRLFSV